MKNNRNTLRSYGLMLLIAAVFAMGAVGCQTLATTAVGKMVDQDSWIPLKAGGPQIGTWDGPDVTVKYNYVRAGDNLNLKGEVRYASRIADNFTLIQYFHLDVLFVDSQGKVLDEQPFASDAFETLTPRALDPTVPFSREVILPVNTEAMAFSYKGQAISSGDGTGGPLYFWEYPVH